MSDERPPGPQIGGLSCSRKGDMARALCGIHHAVDLRTADWFRDAIATGTGQIVAGGTAYDVAFTEADDGDLAVVDAAYRRKYGQYASIVDHLEGDGPRAATLQVHPA
jgi:hypothetical protein